jgi:simple sugar transport system permease protein
VPLVLAGLGELVAERAGVINIGIEGLMLTGCIAAFAAGAMSGSGAVAVVAAIGAAAALSGVFAVATVLARVDQIVCGMAINLLAIGASGTAWAALQASGYSDLPEGAGFEPVWPRGIGQYALAWVTLALAATLWWKLRWTRAGLIVRSLGEAPEACAAAGIGVRRWRFGCVVFAGGCAGLAGAYLSVMRVHGFSPDMTGGQGFMVLALVIFGRWSVPGLVAGCLFFGAVESMQEHLQGFATAGSRAHESTLQSIARQLPYQAFRALPYLVALLALAALTRSAPGPSRLGQPWPERE